jgi:hypothetical protein
MRPDGAPITSAALSAVFDLLRAFALIGPPRFRFGSIFPGDRSIRGKQPVVGIPICRLLPAARRGDRCDRQLRPKFFLYFEYFDWSVRLTKVTQSAYLPAFHAIHHGGGAARKGMKHIALFVKSGFRFYNKHGWRWF